MTKLSHLQRAHILALYVKYLQPLTNISHFEGKTPKNNVDAICPRLRELEGDKLSLLNCMATGHGPVSVIAVTRFFERK